MTKSGGSVRPRIGNDIVDLMHPACRGRSSGDRLLHRILTAEERVWLEAGPPGLWEVRLWALWAAKEAAFKVGAKLEGSTVFAPGTLQAELTVEAAGSPMRIEGSVQGPGLGGVIRVTGESDGSYLHLIALGSGGAERGSGRLEIGFEALSGDAAASDLSGFREHFTEEEWEGIHSVPSAEVRMLARERLRAAIGVDEGAGIEILTSGIRPGRTPPRIRVGGRERDDLDVTLSHHGRFLAWGILLP